ncbi:ArsR/SmtB family transcription factor [Elusimicrobiota bacterium]
MTPKKPFGSEEELARLLKALGTPQRLRILNVLNQNQPATASVIARQMRPVPLQTSLLTHLRVLRECGLVKAEKVGVSLYYSVDSGKFKRVLQIFRDLGQV